jgi:hypothetical protein
VSRVTLPVTLALASENGRICPKPPYWAKLYDMLPGTRRDSYGSIPAEPLPEASGDEQMLGRLREHLQWAQQHGALDRVHQFLARLPEGAWRHAGD